MRRLVELYGELSGGTHGFIDFPLPWRSVQLASVAVRMLDTLVQLAFAADPSLGVSVPLATSPLGVLVPLAPPAGIAAPARRTRPPIVLRPEGLMGMEGKRKEKRKIALEILNEADKIMDGQNAGG